MYYLETHSLTNEERLKYEQMGLHCYDLRLDDDCNEVATIEKHVRVNSFGSIITSEELVFPEVKTEDYYIDYPEFVNSDANSSVLDLHELLDKKLIVESKAHTAKCEQGVCPCCHQSNLDYEVADIVDDCIVYPWTCPVCGHTGEEWYDLSFSGHNVNTIDDEMLTLDAGEQDSEGGEI